MCAPADARQPEAAAAGIDHAQELAGRHHVDCCRGRLVAQLRQVPVAEQLVLGTLVDDSLFVGLADDHHFADHHSTDDFDALAGAPSVLLRTRWHAVGSM